MKRLRYAHMSYIDRSYTSEKQLRKCTRHIVFSQKTSPQIVRGWHDKMNQAPRAFCSFLYCLWLCVAWYSNITIIPSYTPSFYLSRLYEAANETPRNNWLQKIPFFSKAKMLLFAFDLFFSLYYYDVVNIVIIAAVHFMCTNAWDLSL